MKSQLFQEIQISCPPKRSIVALDPYKRHKNNYSVQNNKKSTSKSLKSQYREMNHSIKNFKKSKIQTEKRQTKMTNYKPVEYAQSIVQILPVSYQKDIQMVYSQLKSQKEKELKSLKMSNQQLLTHQKQKFIKMQKKFLLKEKQYIELLSSVNMLEKQYQKQKQQKSYLSEQLNQKNLKQSSYLEQIKLLKEQASAKHQKNQNLHYFLRLFLQQTQIVINWGKIFQLSSEDLPPMINIIKKDIENRKFDLQITLKQASNFQKLNFSNIQHKNDSKNNTFIDEEEYYNESFMKYFKQQSAQSKPKSFKSTYPMEYSSCLLQFDGNKQNFDNNSKSINTLHAFIDDKAKMKNKMDSSSEEYLRILLLQAKTIEKKHQKMYYSVPKNKDIQIPGIKCCQSENISISMQ